MAYNTPETVADYLARFQMERGAREPLRDERGNGSRGLWDGL